MRCATSTGSKTRRLRRELIADEEVHRRWRRAAERCGRGPSALPVRSPRIRSRRVERPVPDSGPGEIRVAVSVCGVCRTDLHLAEGDLAPRRRGVVPGHEVVGRVDRARRWRDVVSQSAIASASRGFAIRAARAGSVCGATRTCASLLASRAGTTTVATRRWPSWTSATPIRSPTSTTTTRPRRCCAPGSSGSARCVARACPRAAGSASTGSALRRISPPRWRCTREPPCMSSPGRRRPRQLALELGAASAGDAYDLPPEPLDAAILFAPVGDLVPVAMRALDRGGTLAIAGIHLSDIPTLSYEREVFQERSLRSVTANTRTRRRRAAGHRGASPPARRDDAVRVRSSRSGARRPRWRPGERGCGHPGRLT